jgi:hypothetical protein
MRQDASTVNTGCENPHRSVQMEEDAVQVDWAKSISRLFFVTAQLYHTDAEVRNHSVAAVASPAVRRVNGAGELNTWHPSPPQDSFLGVIC